LFSGLRNEVCGVLPVLREFAAKNDVLAIWSKNLTQRNYVELVGRVD